MYHWTDPFFALWAAYGVDFDIGAYALDGSLEIGQEFMMQIFPSQLHPI